VVVDAGVADPARIAVGGHSYGAFMAANLLAHAGHLFAAGIARSGAYNRCGRRNNQQDGCRLTCCMSCADASSNRQHRVMCIWTLRSVACSKALIQFGCPMVVWVCCVCVCQHAASVLPRTLTPFGFQAEERTLWQAPDTYAMMSPFQNADKIKKPLLLIHGADDNNTGQNLKAVAPPIPLLPFIMSLLHIVVVTPL
jgi:fermentation-respiration switch protein FrsA (DUF1100 family)